MFLAHACVEDSGNYECVAHRGESSIAPTLTAWRVLVAAVLVEALHRDHRHKARYAAG